MKFRVGADMNKVYGHIDRMNNQKRYSEDDIKATLDGECGEYQYPQGFQQYAGVMAKKYFENLKKRKDFDQFKRLSELIIYKSREEIFIPEINKTIYLSLSKTDRDTKESECKKNGYSLIGVDESNNQWQEILDIFGEYSTAIPEMFNLNNGPYRTSSINNGFGACISVEPGKKDARIFKTTKTHKDRKAGGLGIKNRESGTNNLEAVNNNPEAIKEIIKNKLSSEVYKNSEKYAKDYWYTDSKQTINVLEQYCWGCLSLINIDSNEIFENNMGLNKEDMENIPQRYLQTISEISGTVCNTKGIDRESFRRLRGIDRFHIPSLAKIVIESTFEFMPKSFINTLSDGVNENLNRKNIEESKKSFLSYLKRSVHSEAVKDSFEIALVHILYTDLERYPNSNQKYDEILYDFAKKYIRDNKIDVQSFREEFINLELFNQQWIKCGITKTINFTLESLSKEMVQEYYNQKE